MNITNIAYSYPVLSKYNDDYTDSSFDIEYELKDLGFNSKKLVSKFILKDQIIEDMVNNNLASYVLHVECSRTSYRITHEVNKISREIEIAIDPDLMRDTVEINGFIILNEDIKVYKNKNINTYIYGEDYSVRNLERGNILATTLTKKIEIKINQDDFESISSIIKVGESKDDFIEVDIDGDVILVKVPSNQYIQYVRLSNTVYSDIIMTSIILPSLVYILDTISEEDNKWGYSDLNWFKVIESKLELKDILIEDINKVHSSMKLAQMILELPVERALDAIEAEVEREVL